MMDSENFEARLMLGVGIDDMFVLVQSYENLTEEEKKEERRSVIFSSLLSLYVFGFEVRVSSLGRLPRAGCGKTTAGV